MNPKDGQKLDSGSDAVEPNPEVVTAKIEEVRTETRLKLADLQKAVEGSLDDDERKKINEVIEEGDSLTQLVTGITDSIFGKDSKVSEYAGRMAGWIFNHLGLSGDSPVADKDFFDFSKESAIEAAVIAHRGGTYEGFDKPNSLEGLEFALEEKGEHEVEIDLRLINGELYLRHDPIGKEKTDGLTKFADVLPLFAKHKEAKMFLDVKATGGGLEEVKAIAKQIQEYDQANADQPGYVPLAKRMVITSFNPSVVKAATETFPNQPVFFHYLPMGHYEMVGQVATAAGSFMPEIMKQVDSLNSNKTNFAAATADMSLVNNHEDVFTLPSGMDNKEPVYSYKLLPPEPMLAALKKTGGYLSVPWPLVRGYKDFFKAAKKEGIKVAVWGFKKPSGASEYDQHNKEVKEAITMGANMIITDHPNIIDQAA